MKGTETSHAAEPPRTALQFQTNPPDHILVAEDDIFFRRLNTEVLERSGYDVDAAADGAAAWQALNTDGYDLLITDNSMPKVSGVELLKKLRAARMTLPVIMATAALPEADLFDRYPWLQPAVALLKPYSVEQLLGTVRKFLRATDYACSPREIGGAEARPMEWASGGAGHAAEVIPRGKGPSAEVISRGERLVLFVFTGVRLG